MGPGLDEMTQGTCPNPDCLRLAGWSKFPASELPGYTGPYEYYYFNKDASPDCQWKRPDCQCRYYYKICKDCGNRFKPEEVDERLGEDSNGDDDEWPYCKARCSKLHNWSRRRLTGQRLITATNWI